MSEELIIAIYHQDIDKVIQLLEDPSTDLNFRYKPKSRNRDIEVTPLQFAASTGNTAIIEALLNKGADPLAKSGIGRTALSIAANFGHLEACELLLQFFGKIDSDEKRLKAFESLLTADRCGITAYEYAKVGKNSATIADKIERCENTQKYLAFPTYLQALRNDRNDLVETIEKDGLDLVEIFVTSCEHTDPMIIRKMLQRQSVNINDYYNGMTGLHTACIKMRSEIIYELLRHKEIDVNLASKDKNFLGYTALHFLSHHQECLNQSTPADGSQHQPRIDLAEALLNHEIDINCREYTGFTPIHLAIISNDLELVQLYVLRGVDLNLRYKYPEDIITKHFKIEESFYGNLLTFSITRPEINKYLEEIIQGKVTLKKAQRIGGLTRVNYNYSEDQRIKPLKIYELEDKNELYTTSHI